MEEETVIEKDLDMDLDMVMVIDTVLIMDIMVMALTVMDPMVMVQGIALDHSQKKKKAPDLDLLTRKKS
jgi:hypothetical protein